MLLKLPQAAAGVWAEAVLTSEGSTEGGSTSKLPTALVGRLQLLTGDRASGLGSPRHVDQTSLIFLLLSTECVCSPKVTR